MAHRYMYPHMRVAEDDDEIKTPAIIDIKKKPYQQYETTFTASQLHFYLNEDIGESHEYTDMIYRITYAGAGDVIYIHLNTHVGVS